MDDRKPSDGASRAARGSRRAMALLSLACAMAAARAGQAPPSAALEARVTRLSEELRCLVCQNQSLADSQAPLALDLKHQVRVQLAQGRTEDEVRDYLVRRYGEFVLYRPPLQGNTWLLWFAPAGLVLAGIVLLGRQGRGTRPPAGEAGEATRHGAPIPTPSPTPAFSTPSAP